MACLRDSFHDGVIIGGRYQTISPLNHGSFGMVFKAKDLKTDQIVAVKCLTKKSAVNDPNAEYAVDDQSEELVLHSRLGSHPNIVNLLDSFETDAHIYLVLEYCARGDLYEAIRNDYGPLETEHVRRFMLELVDAVEYMHSKGVYHRDIKPENIFLTQTGSMKLGDFGLATTDKWSYESMVGSDRYMSPEQYDSAGAGYSPAQADIWAIGICLLNILFSRNPFTTPTEQDPLFLDFSRDKQSLFDVFPSMSQDTFEVIVQCMNLDPSKRSLAGVREALLRVVSFTTLDEALDDFCTADRPVVATSNREPLRTPSIQSPQVDNGAFPWTKALQTTPPKPIRQLDNVPDDMYEEDLFSQSGKTTTDWMSATTHTPMSSYMESNLGVSFTGTPLSFEPKLPAKAAAKVAPVAASLPIDMSKNREPAISWVFGRKDAVSKSWSDLWDEEFEEEEERKQQLQILKEEMNSRTWSHESTASPSPSVENDDTPRQGMSPVTKTASLVKDENKAASADAYNNSVGEDPDTDGLFFYEAPPAPKEEPQKLTQPQPVPEPQPIPTRHHVPPSKRSDIDKWALLGERRRAYAAGSSSVKVPDVPLRTGRQVGTGFPASSPPKGHGVFDVYNESSHHDSFYVSGGKSPQNQHHFYHHHGSQHHHQGQGRRSNRGGDRPKECPWTKGRNAATHTSSPNNRDWIWKFDWRSKEKRNPLGCLEWVGNWPTARS
ncbi:serine/threonine protein kinase-like protein [Thermochaetoides thermophila DSM 1495]|uniref:non-specific serine/threonine protein kinase n=1 Tax=Chaetomium thermophilum (strain DSM 1495 / CBS 144.50 / IMI 039719) TaxID=759272 RepID=G0S510_CHATD|nr:serine/threonine protein kinase-like protein [Thermochaetoides thermophila DSM 1495]EGS20535.1 serine/threonine protein kinase-like protein [Thermochaetoides thermophila DSM 1495]